MQEKIQYFVQNLYNEILAGTGNNLGIRGRTPLPHEHCDLCPDTRKPIPQQEIYKQENFLGLIPYKTSVLQVNNQPVNGGEVKVKLYDKSMHGIVSSHLEDFSSQTGLEYRIE